MSPPSGAAAAAAAITGDGRRLRLGREKVRETTKLATNDDHSPSWSGRGSLAFPLVRGSVRLTFAT